VSAKAAEGAATALQHSGQKKRYCGSWAAVSASLKSRGDPSRPGEMDHHDDTSGGHHHDDHDHGKLLMIIHGSLMLLGWGILLPLGILASIVRSRFSVGDATDARRGCSGTGTSSSQGLQLVSQGLPSPR